MTKEVGRSTLELFEKYTGLYSPDNPKAQAGATIVSSAHKIGSNLEGITLVGGIPGAVGYVSMGTADILREKGMSVKLLKLAGVDATRAAVVNGQYPIIRELNLVYHKGSIQIIPFMETALSAAGQKIVADDGFIPIR